ncbi:MAG: beta-hydroxyacyl-ACP dehydratase [Lachnoclostridium sp.]|nr:beta-hydroxyacyl-ACP dehydratase [Lachnospira sp.]MCM1247299.1 beta-hydroxyacyl-ACP dehydratase [Lachnoclostridium sp.]MCM1534399.1 beta-hydroxyacyl-ACP dehydratase [Clostridium sp.]
MKNGDKIVLDAVGIQQCQRNRYPLLFIDKIVDGEVGKFVHAVKNFCYNEWFFPAHFDDEPNVPGFIQAECLAQTFIMTFLTMDEHMGKKTAFVKQDGVRFRRKIVPGDRLDIYAYLDSFQRGIAKGHVESFVDGEPAVSGKLVIALPDILDNYRPKEEL